MAELNIWNRFKNLMPNTWQQKALTSYAEIDTTLSGQDLKTAYESRNSLNRGPIFGPFKRLQTKLNKLKQQMEEALLQQRINHIQQQLAAQVKDLAENRAQLNFQEQQQKQAELQKLQQELLKLQQNMQEQQKVLDNTESAMKGLQTGFVQAATALYVAAYASAGLKLDPQAMRENYVELLGRVQDLSPDMAQFIEKNDLNQPSAGNRLLLTALLEKLAPDAALDQSALTNKAKDVLNEFKPVAKKLDLDETELQKKYDDAISVKGKAVDALQARADDLETGVKNLEKQIKTALVPKPGASAQKVLDEEKAASPTAGPGMSPD